MHTPVLLEKAIEGLDVKEGGLYIDATAGQGGHLSRILEKGGRVLGLDWDPHSVHDLRSGLRRGRLENVVFAVANFSQIEKVAKKLNFYPVDGILFDLGLSMSQISESGRGFSYKKLDDPLDMRVNMATDLTADEIINRSSEEELYEVFAKYGEELLARPIAINIVRSRIDKKIHTVGQLTTVINQVVKNQKKEVQPEKVYARIFQSLRIAVNKEYENLKKALAGSLKVLKPGGRIVIITFHSGEDRIAKQFARENQLKMLQKKVITGWGGARFERSAKLRILVKN